ncbi:cbb3-type cytochrome c oxidase subunit I [Bacillus sp. Marseille-P3661]|uniref:cbb3-type cytochrome c oxidase subunit I n=1 Tax=Bacillus sp. Marseille-P3661 TaxID=1936234 RepID=UPI002155DEF0|nr:cbb3-type cytochrome c oxidase subunit I [Bacillus sp. Marseille-P3661]
MENNTLKVSIDSKTKKSVVFPIVISGSIILLMMVFGVLMLLGQGNLLEINPGMFYKIMTIHGTGMVGAGALAGSAIMWYFLMQYVPLKQVAFTTNFVFFLIGVSMVLVGIFAFDFAGGWTFLYPLPAISGGMWGKTAATLYLSGMLVIGTGFLILFLEVSRAIMKEYGSFSNALGWPYILGKKTGYGPPAAVVASTMVCIVDITALIAGASILIMSIINIFISSFTIDPLLAKNLIYAFGHIFANSIIYMGVIAVYELLSRYTNRPWKSNKIFLIAWNMSTLFTIIIYPHHLLMDTVMPKWMLIIGQVLSYMNGMPVLVVTAYGALMIIYYSGIKWDVASSFLFLSMFGWVIGVVPAIVDATIVINHVMHNTKWVPGHFHMYMGIGACAMIIGFMYYLTKVEGGRTDRGVDRIALWFYLLFFLGVTGSFLFSGKVSAPRRWAEHYPEWIAADVAGAIFGMVVTFCFLLFMVRYIHYASKIGKLVSLNDEYSSEQIRLKKHA